MKFSGYRVAGEKAREVGKSQEDMESQVMGSWTSLRGQLEDNGTTRSLGVWKLHGQICILERLLCAKEKVKEKRSCCLQFVG